MKLPASLNGITILYDILEHFQILLTHSGNQQVMSRYSGKNKTQSHQKVLKRITVTFPNVIC